MTYEQLQERDWGAVQAALFDLMAYTEEYEPQAVNDVAAIETILGGLPDHD